MFVTAAAVYTFTQVLLAGGGGFALGGSAVGVYNKYFANLKDSDKKLKLEELEELLLALYKDLPESAKKLTVKTASNAQEILKNSKDIYSSIKDDEKKFSKQIKLLNTRNVNLKNADAVLKAFAKVTKDNLKIIITELNNRQEIIIATKKELKTVQKQLDIATKNIAKGVEKQTKLQTELERKTDDMNHLVQRFNQLSDAKKREHKPKDTSFELLKSKKENAALKAENARLRQMIAALSDPQQESEIQAPEISASPRM